MPVSDICKPWRCWTAPSRPSASLNLLLPSSPLYLTPPHPSPPAMLSVHCQSGYKHPINCWTCLLQKLSQKKRPRAGTLSQIRAACSGNCQFKRASKFAFATSYSGAVTAEYILGPIPLCGSIIGLRYLRGCCRWAVKGGATAKCNSCKCTRWNLPGWRRLAFSTPSSAMPHLLELGMYYAERGSERALRNYNRGGCWQPLLCVLECVKACFWGGTPWPQALGWVGATLLTQKKERP